MNILCSKCKSRIEKEDYNIATNIAYCRRCDLTHTVADLVEEAQVDFSLLHDPPLGVFSHQDVNNAVVSCRFSRKFLLFLVPFTLLWSGGSMTGIYIVPILKGKLELGQALFGLPFLLGSIVLWTVILMSLFGRLTVRLQGKEGRVTYGIGGRGWTRVFQIAEVEQLRIQNANYETNGRTPKCICIRTRHKDITFADMVKDQYREYIYVWLKKQLRC